MNGGVAPSRPLAGQRYATFQGTSASHRRRLFPSTLLRLLWVPPPLPPPDAALPVNARGARAGGFTCGESADTRGRSHPELKLAPGLWRRRRRLEQEGNRTLGLFLSRRRFCCGRRDVHVKTLRPCGIWSSNFSCFARPEVDAVDVGPCFITTSHSDPQNNLLFVETPLESVHLRRKLIIEHRREPT